MISAGPKRLEILSDQSKAISIRERIERNDLALLSNPGSQIIQDLRLKWRPIEHVHRAGLV